MTDYQELKRLAERSILGHPSAPKNLHDLNQAGSVYRAKTRPAVVLELIAQIERLERKNDNQAQTIREYSDLVMGGDVSLGMLRADLRVTSGERDQLKAEVEALRKALTDIRENSHDISACECAADALIDSRRETK